MKLKRDRDIHRDREKLRDNKVKGERDWVMCKIWIISFFL